MTKNQLALLTALAVDNFGSGLFLPLALVYANQVVGLPLGIAGLAVAIGTAAGLLVPPVAGRLVDRAGPRPVVITSQLVQAAGAFAYLAADGVVMVTLAAVLLATGQQLFYSSLFALISDVAGAGPKDRPFAVVGMVRSAGFGLGGLAVGGLLTAAGPAAYQVAVAADGISFLLCALVLAKWVSAPHPRDTVHDEAVAPRRLLADRPFLALIATTSLVMLAIDFFLMGIPVYTLDQLRTDPWVPGTILALQTALTSTAGTLALRATRRLSRIAAMALGSVMVVLWCAANLAALALPPAWQPVQLLAATVLLAAGSLCFGSRANAMAVDLAPTAVRGRYLAAFQYSFTIPGVLTPAVVALFSVAVWLPWVVVAVCAAVAVGALYWLQPRLPATAEPAIAVTTPRT